MSDPVTVRKNSLNSRIAATYKMYIAAIPGVKSPAINLSVPVIDKDLWYEVIYMLGRR